jgi:dolichol-phosphate mannosyltransferase
VPALEIVIPVYNEGQNILHVLDSLASNVRTSFSVLICYDRDDDTTLEALRNYPPGRVAVRTIKNQGIGAHGAVVTGFRESTAGAVLMFPADDTYNAPIVDSMVHLIEEGSDIVAPSRFMKGGRMEGCPWLKAALVRTTAFTLYHLARTPTHDPTNGFRMFSRRALDQIVIESDVGFTYSLELLAKCHRLGWRVSEVPAGWYERKHGKSRFRVAKWGPAYLKWYFYSFATTYLRRGPKTVRLVYKSSSG